ncbi:MAG: TonB-dependent siderophore receptor [Acaryochloridaceae cyanobacterium CSU_3_4]|nr:TonB-dependent siderophore receptor [Acaryochloridaceae cyanobacterium CSU_3_4]
MRQVSSIWRTAIVCSCFVAMMAVPSRAQEVITDAEDDSPATSVKEWMAQIEASLAQITGVRVETTETGLQVLLDAEGAVSEPVTRVEGNTLIAEIANATLTEPFSQADPAAGIEVVNVTPLSGDRVQIEIIGINAPPVAEVSAVETGLVLAVTPGSAEVAEDDEVEITVTAERQDEGYNPSSASTATRTETPLRDIPQSIQVVPRQVIEDRNPDTIIEATETVSGVVYNGGFADAPTGSVIIRGFAQPQQFRNGFRDTDRTGLTALGTVEQIEVLKGPASVLFGSVEPGGIINVVTRQPLSDPAYNLSFEVGNRNFFQPSVDLTGPINKDKSVLYRFIAGYQNSDSFQEFANSDILTIAPSIAIKFGDKTSLNLFYEYIDYSGSPPESYSFLFSDGSLPPRNLFAGYPFSFRDLTTQKFGYSFKHEFSDNWQIRHNFSAAVSDAEDSETFPLALVDDSILELGIDEREFKRDTYYGNIDVLGKFNTGPVSHQLLIGFDINRTEDAFAFSEGAVPDLDIFNPNYDVPRPDDFVPAFSDANFITNYGFYLQDQVDLLKNLKLLVGGRFDWISQRTEVEGEIPQKQSDSAFSPRVGLVYQPSDTVALYASYSRSFLPTFGSSLNGEPFEPTRGTQYEVGAKTDFLDGRLSATIAAYQLTRSNITTPDPIDPDFSIQVGEQRSRGIELDVTGAVLPGWNVTASYAYTDAKITEDNEFSEGNRLTNVPDHQASLWTTYEIQSGDLEGLGFGLGLFYVGERQGDLNNSFSLSDYLRTDLALFYRRNRFKVALNFRNLFNTDYFRASDGGDLFLFRGEPFTVIGSVSWEF